MSKYEEIRSKINELQKQADELFVAEKKAAIADIKDKIRLYGLSAVDVGLAPKGAKEPKVAKPARAAKPSAVKSAKAAAGVKAEKAVKATKAVKAAKAAKTVPAAPKYLGPNGETWGGGRGKRPQWVNAALAAGVDLEKYRVM
jgi:DNA-binding protein H-NS